MSQLPSRYSWNTLWPTHNFVQWKNWTPGGWQVTKTKLGMARMWGAESQMEQTDFIYMQLVALDIKPEQTQIKINVQFNKLLQEF